MGIFKVYSIYLLFISIFTDTFSDVVNFKEQVWPILEERCIECHKAPFEKNGSLKIPKAGLRLDGAAFIMHGSDDGPVVVVNHPSKSSLYQRVILEETDSDHMPPKGGSLSKKQKEILRMWIAQGVDFGTWIGVTEGIDELNMKKKQDQLPQAEYLKKFELLSKGLSQINREELEIISLKSKLLVRPLGVGSLLVEARAVTEAEDISDESIKNLVKIKDRLVKVDLRNSSISDQSLIFLAEFPLLTHLNLSGTAVSSSGISYLSRASSLETLNLVKTSVSNDIVNNLISYPNLRSVYLWNSKFTSEGVDELQNKKPNLEISF